MTPVFEVRWGAATHEGHVRGENQDAFVAEPPLFLVADGMGGHRAGRAAAESTTSAFRAQDWGGWASPYSVNAAAVSAGGAVAALADGATGSAPGSTVSGAALSCHGTAPHWLIFNIGDSRTYLLRDGELAQVTIDHSQRQALIDRGMSDDEADARSQSNVITRAIGGGLARRPDPDLWLLPARTGDRILVCSDGLSGEMSTPLLAAILLSESDPQDAANSLLAAALAGEARDNVTAVVVDAVRVARSDDHEEEHGDTVDTVDEISAHLSGDTRPDLEVVT